MECPYCKKEFSENHWGMHTIECPENPKNKKKEIKKIVRKPKKK